MPPSTVSEPAGRDQWDEHWDDFGRAQERNPAQEYRRRLTLSLLERERSPARLLDIGSGAGELLAAAAVRWPRAELLGLELSEVGVAQAQRRVPAARFRACDLVRDPVPAEGELGWATHAACSEVLEHVDDPVKLLRNARAWLAPGAYVVVTVPGGPMSAYDRHTGHRRHYRPDELGEILRAAELEVLDLVGAGFPVFNLYRSVVITRGERLITDARADAGSILARATMAAFGALFRIPLPRTSLGWQTVGLARVPLEATLAGASS